MMGEITPKQLEALLSSRQTLVDEETGIRSLGSTTAVAAKLARKKMLEEAAEMGVPQALLRTSIAGQVSDLAQGVRYAGDSDASKSAMVPSIQST